MSPDLVACSTCGDETDRNVRRGKCQRCYNREYKRERTADAKRREAEREPVIHPTLAERIEQEIAKGTPTRDIMARLVVDYGVVKRVRDDMNAAEAS